MDLNLYHTTFHGHALSHNAGCKYTPTICAEGRNCYLWVSLSKTCDVEITTGMPCIDDHKAQGNNARWEKKYI